ncbi:hypothetical protein LCGC14_0817540 [marine sediment metagenome]|uniref:Uncharacterized protein n=1 Tax=marine sediment metagenome TaxID=412755 RepID=A0A0F9SS96_9ZZZZ
MSEVLCDDQRPIDEQMLCCFCDLPVGHTGDHIQRSRNTAIKSWPQAPRVEMCQDKTVLYNGTTKQCSRPIGHEGPHLVKCGKWSFHVWAKLGESLIENASDLLTSLKEV